MTDTQKIKDLLIHYADKLPSEFRGLIRTVLYERDQEVERLKEENLSLKLAVDIEQYVKRIKSLNEENQRLRKALEEIANGFELLETNKLGKIMQEIARQALDNNR